MESHPKLQMKWNLSKSGLNGIWSKSMKSWVKVKSWILVEGHQGQSGPWDQAKYTEYLDKLSLRIHLLFAQLNSTLVMIWHY